MRAKPDPKTREKHVRTLETSHRNWTERVGDFEPLREKRKKKFCMFMFSYTTLALWVLYNTRRAAADMREWRKKKKLTIFTLGTPNRPTRWSLWWTAKSIQAQTLFAQFSVLFEKKSRDRCLGPERERDEHFPSLIDVTLLRWTSENSSQLFFSATADSLTTMQRKLNSRAFQFQ